MMSYIEGMDIPDVHSPLRKVIQKQNDYIDCLLEAKKVHRKTAVAACCLCFVVGILVGMFLVDQHYNGAIQVIDFELEVEPTEGTPKTEE
jgi:hypothetical protein